MKERRYGMPGPSQRQELGEAPRDVTYLPLIEQNRNIRALILTSDHDNPAMASTVTQGLATERIDPFVAEVENMHAALEEINPDIVLVSSMGSASQEISKKLPLSTPFVMLSTRENDPNDVFATTRIYIDAVRSMVHQDAAHFEKEFGNGPVLAAHIRAILRRTEHQQQPPEVIKIGNLEINITGGIVRKNNEAVILTPAEWKLLSEFAKSPGRVMLSSQLLSNAWGSEFRDYREHLQKYISKVRKKIEDDPKHPTYIRTVPGLGYMLVGPDEYKTI